MPISTAKIPATLPMTVSESKTDVSPSLSWTLIFSESLSFTDLPLDFSLHYPTDQSEPDFLLMSVLNSPVIWSFDLTSVNGQFSPFLNVSLLHPTRSFPHVTNVAISSSSSRVFVVENSNDEVCSLLYAISLTNKTELRDIGPPLGDLQFYGNLLVDDDNGWLYTTVSTLNQQENSVWIFNLNTTNPSYRVLFDMSAYPNVVTSLAFFDLQRTQLLASTLFGYEFFVFDIPSNMIKALQNVNSNGNVTAAHEMNYQMLYNPLDEHIIMGIHPDNEVAGIWGVDYQSNENCPINLLGTVPYVSNVQAIKWGFDGSSSSLSTSKSGTPQSKNIFVLTADAFHFEYNLYMISPLN